MDEEQAQMEAMVREAVDALRSTNRFPETDLFPTVAECLGFMGKLVELFEREAPSVAKTAAVVLFVERMKLDRAGDDALAKVGLVVEALREGFIKAARAPS